MGLSGATRGQMVPIDAKQGQTGSNEAKNRAKKCFTGPNVAKRATGPNEAKRGHMGLIFRGESLSRTRPVSHSVTQLVTF